MNIGDPDVFAWRDDNGQLHMLRILGHRVLVRRCEWPETKWAAGKVVFTDSFTKQYANMANSMMASYCRNITGDPDSWMFGAEVLAIGAEVNGPRATAWKRRFAIPPKMRHGVWNGKKSFVDLNISCTFSRGDIIILPENSAWQLMWRPITGSPDDVLVDVSEILAYIPAA